MNRHTAHSVAASALITALLAGCGSDSPTTAPVMDPGDGGNYRPHLDPNEIADVIDNPYLPLTVGSHWRYEGESDGEQEVVEIIVTPDRKTVSGISAFVVRDTATVDGEIVEDTYDWFTQDSAGNVWYLGEDVKEYDEGKVVSTEGSWEAGVDGALPGIAMPAAFHVGDVIRQEFDEGTAEDMMEITGTGSDLTVRAQAYTDVVVTHDWSPLEPDVIEEKSYASGVGMVRETDVAGAPGYSELVEYVAGG